MEKYLHNIEMDYLHKYFDSYEKDNGTSERFRLKYFQNFYRKNSPKENFVTMTLYSQENKSYLNSCTTVFQIY